MEDDQYLTDRDGNHKYVRRKLIGTGGFAKCFEVQSIEDKKVYAAKVISKKSISQKRQRYKLMLEIKLHRSLNHEFIVGFHDVFEDSENIYIILENCPFHTLKRLVSRRKRLTEYEVRIYLYQMATALTYLHSKHIIHRDLKLGNVLLDGDMRTKICDFGLSTRIREVGEKRKTVCGTPNYIAPEILEEMGHSYQVDVWSLGVIVFTMLVGKPPFQDQTVDSTYENIRNNRYSFPNIEISEQARDLVERILVTDPAQRLTLDQILSHDFMLPTETLTTLLPRYTIAIPPHEGASRRMRPLDTFPLELTHEQLPHHSLTIDKSIIVKHSQNEDSQSMDQIEFSVAKRREKPTNCGYLVYVRQAVISGGDIGFLLSNGIMGIYYPQDRTSLILEYDEKYFVYVERADSEKYTTSKFNVGILDSKIQAKYDKFKHFLCLFKMKYFNDQFEQMRKRYRERQLQLVFIKKVLVLKDDLVMRLSNGIIQMQLGDRSSVFSVKSLPNHRYICSKNGEQSVVFIEQADKLKDQHLRKRISKFQKLIEKLKVRAETITEFRLSIQ